MSAFVNRSAFGWVLCVVAFLSTGAYAEVGDGQSITRSVADRAAATITRLHQNASRALVNAAQDRTFSEFFLAHDTDQMRALKDRIDSISLTVQDRFHVEEMCLIDPNGHEISRIVGDEIAFDLATDEAGAPFFGPGFATPARSVHVAPIYLSADANRWVVSYVTPIVLDGSARSILHYEHGLDAFTSHLDVIADRSKTNIMLVAASGHLIYDSRAPIQIERRGAFDARDDYFQQVNGFDPTSGEWLSALTGLPVYDVVASSRTVKEWTIVAWRSN